MEIAHVAVVVVGVALAVFAQEKVGPWLTRKLIDWLEREPTEKEIDRFFKRLEKDPDFWR